MFHFLPENTFGKFACSVTLGAGFRVGEVRYLYFGCPIRNPVPQMCSLMDFRNGTREGGTCTKSNELQILGIIDIVAYRKTRNTLSQMTYLLAQTKPAGSHILRS